MTECIICQQEHRSETVEHIVPRSLGNIHYVLRKGLVCSNCNNRFARFEHEVVTSEPFMRRRLKLGVIKEVPIEAKKLTHKSLQLFLLKVFYESVHKSKPHLLKSHDIDHVRNSLLRAHVRNDHPMEQHYQPKERLTNLIDHWRLSGAGIKLYLDETPSGFKFTFVYADIKFTIGI